MESYIDKWRSGVFTAIELDIIYDAIDQFLFKDFFQSDNTLLSIYFIEHDGDGNKVMECHNKNLDPRAEYLMRALMTGAATQVPVNDLRKFIALKAHDTDSGVRLFFIMMTFSFGCVITTAGTDNDLDLENGLIGLVGLTKLICDLLGKRDDSAQHLADQLPSNVGGQLDASTCESIKRRIAAFLHGNNDSVKRWVETLED